MPQELYSGKIEINYMLKIDIWRKSPPKIFGCTEGLILRATRVSKSNPDTLLAKTTVAAFNSCTICVGSLRIIEDCTSDCHPISGTWMTSHEL